MAGNSLSARRHVGRRRRQLRALLRARHQGRVVPVRLARRRHRGRAPRAAGTDGHGLARLHAPRAPWPALRLPRLRPVRTDVRPPVQPEQGAHGSVRQGRRPRRPVGQLRDVRVQGGRPGRGPVVRHARQRAPGAARRRHRPGVHVGRRPTSAHAVAQDDHLRNARARLHEAPPGPPRAAPRHVRGPDDRRGARSPDETRRDRRRADAGAPPRRRAPARGARPSQLLGLQHVLLLRARARLQREPLARRQRARVQAHGARAPLGRPRGDPRRRVQPHGRGEPPGPDALAARDRQRLGTTASTRTARATTSTSPAAATR